MDQRGCHSIGVELAGSCNQHGPRYAPQKTQDIGVDIMTCKRLKCNLCLNFCKPPNQPQEWTDLSFFQFHILTKVKWSQMEIKYQLFFNKVQTWACTVARQQMQAKRISWGTILPCCFSLTALIPTNTTGHLRSQWGLFSHKTSCDMFHKQSAMLTHKQLLTFGPQFDGS